MRHRHELIRVVLAALSPLFDPDLPGLLHLGHVRPGDVLQVLVDDLRSKFAIDDPDAPENWPRVLTVWRANLLGSSSKGNEYFLKHLLGTDHA